MILIAAFILGVTLASAGTIAKNINSSIGAQIANRRIHTYLTVLGGLSNMVLPIIFIIMACTVQGAGEGGMALLGIVSGAIVLGMLRLPYPFRLLLSVFGVPLAGALFVIGLFL
jgi:hypothetical protein